MIVLPVGASVSGVAGAHPVGPMAPIVVFSETGNRRFGSS